MSDNTHQLPDLMVDPMVPPGFVELHDADGKLLIRAPLEATEDAKRPTPEVEGSAGREETGGG